MNSKIEIKLNIPKGQIVSDLKERVFREELYNINEVEPLKKNQISLTATYFSLKKSELEVGFFIRNTLESGIALGNVELAIQSAKGEIIATSYYNLKEFGIMPRYTGTPCSLNFILNNGIVYNSDEDYKIIFVNVENLIGSKSINTDIENIPIDISFEEEEEIRKFEKSLNTLRKDEIDIAILKLKRMDDGDINITLLIRNGYDIDVKLEKLPVTIINYNNYPICKHVFCDSNGLINISSQGAKLLKLSIDKSKLYNTVFDLDRCKILFQ